MSARVVRGQQDDDHLKLSFDRKVSPRATRQASRARWIPTVPNSFGLPAGTSCPGATSFCESCYAKGSEQSAGVKDLVDHNLRLLTGATAAGMVVLLHEMIERYIGEAAAQDLAPEEYTFRIHWDGDFFSLDYAMAWRVVISSFPQIKFWAYTRSFRGAVDVVPVLAGIENLALYLSTDGDNVTDALAVVERYPTVLVAPCAVDYESGRALTVVAGRRTIVCPENKGTKLLVDDDGRGACVTCRVCPDGTADVIFSTTHVDNVELTGASRRADCSVCGANTALTHGGAIRSHFGPRRKCEGSGRLPLRRGQEPVAPSDDWKERLVKRTFIINAGPEDEGRTDAVLVPAPTRRRPAEPEPPEPVVDMVAEAEPTEFECPRCPRTFKSPHAVKIHLGHSHSDAARRSPSAPISAAQPIPIDAPSSPAEPEMLPCPLCDRPFRGQRGLTAHFVSKHAGRNGIPATQRPVTTAPRTMAQKSHPAIAAVLAPRRSKLTVVGDGCDCRPLPGTTDQPSYDNPLCALHGLGVRLCARELVPFTVDEPASCPACGPCTCSTARDGSPLYDDGNCPIHSLASPHS